MLITAGDQQAVKHVLPSFLSSTDFGFVATGALNALSFWPQLGLLRSIYSSHKAYLKPVVVEVDKDQVKEDTCKEVSVWAVWWRHAGGLAWLSSSYALLYLTVLSPHGALLTGYLITENVPAYQLSLVRGAGALLGVFGVTFQPAAARFLGDRLADGFSVCWLAGWMVTAMIAFNAAGATRGHGLTIPLLIFVSAVCLGRPGLYSFELGILNKEQDLVDKRHRSAIGAVDTALTSLGTVVMYLAGLVWNRTSQFGNLVIGSAFFVTLGALVYLLWTCLFKVTRHRHADHEHGHGQSGHGHSHGSDQDHQHHIHTLQMEELLEDGWHEHLTYDPSICCLQ
jgi:iron-regulated transporter 1